jgi:hypothetical protein
MYDKYLKLRGENSSTNRINWKISRKNINEMK